MKETSSLLSDGSDVDLSTRPQAADDTWVSVIIQCLCLVDVISNIDVAQLLGLIIFRKVSYAVWPCLF